MQLRLDKTGSDFLPLYLQRIVAISCVIRRTTKEGLPQIKVGSLGNPDDSEKVLIQAFFDLIEKYTPQLVSWNGSGFDLPVLHYRALINQVHARATGKWARAKIAIAASLSGITTSAATTCGIWI
jgi:3'-5' exonuclease